MKQNIAKQVLYTPDLAHHIDKFITKNPNTKSFYPENKLYLVENIMHTLLKHVNKDIITTVFMTISASTFSISLGSESKILFQYIFVHDNILPVIISALIHTFSKIKLIIISVVVVDDFQDLESEIKHVIPKNNKVKIIYQDFATRNVIIIS